MPEIWLILSALAKLLLYLGALGACGLLMVRQVLGLSRIGVQAGVCAALGLLAAICGFMLTGTTLTGDLSGALDPDILGLLWGTQAGDTLVWRMGGFAVMLVALIGCRRLDLFAMAGGAAVLWSFTLIGHVPDQGGLWLRIVLLLHLICAAFWLGVLAPLHRVLRDPARMDQAADVAERFGTRALLAVPLLLIAGGVMSYVLAGGLEGLWTGYGRILMLKVAGVAVLVALGAVNKLSLVPGLRAGTDRSAERLQRIITVEGVAMVAVLSATAALTTLVGAPG